MKSRSIEEGRAAIEKIDMLIDEGNRKREKLHAKMLLRGRQEMFWFSLVAILATLSHFLLLLATLCLGLIMFGVLDNWMFNECIKGIQKFNNEREMP